MPDFYHFSCTHYTINGPLCLAPQGFFDCSVDIIIRLDSHAVNDMTNANLWKLPQHLLRHRIGVFGVGGLSFRISSLVRIGDDLIHVRYATLRWAATKLIMNANCCHISFYFRSDHKLSFLHYYYCSHYCHFTQKLCKQRQPYRIHFGMSQHTYYVIRLPVLLSTYSSYLPRAPDDRDITGRPWQGCHNSAASFYSCAAGFPL